MRDRRKRGSLLYELDSVVVLCAYNAGSAYPRARPKIPLSLYDNEINTSIINIITWVICNGWLSSAARGSCYRSKTALLRYMVSDCVLRRWCKSPLVQLDILHAQAIRLCRSALNLRDQSGLTSAHACLHTSTGWVGNETCPLCETIILSLHTHA
jgi:hypothetical protein